MSDVQVNNSTQAIILEQHDQEIVVDPITSTAIVVNNAPVSVSIVNAGPQGPRGIQGPPVNFPSYIHDQTTPSSAWVIPHSLGRKPVSVLVIDSGDNPIEGELVYVDNNNLTIIFDVAPFSGTAFVN
jgi:hypothetical protein